MCFLQLHQGNLKNCSNIRNNVAELVYARRGGISMNLVSETALGETQVALSCAENARESTCSAPIKKHFLQVE